MSNKNTTIKVITTHPVTKNTTTHSISQNQTKTFQHYITATIIDNTEIENNIQTLMSREMFYID